MPRYKKKRPNLLFAVLAVLAWMFVAYLLVQTSDNLKEKYAIVYHVR